MFEAQTGSGRSLHGEVMGHEVSVSLKIRFSVNEVSCALLWNSWHSGRLYAVWAITEVSDNC